jgi:hypothetical protein
MEVDLYGIVGLLAAGAIAWEFVKFFLMETG